MKLSELDPALGIRVARDGAFAALGFLRSARPESLCPLSSRKYLGQLGANGNVSAVITAEELLPEVPDHVAVGVSPDPLSAFFSVHCSLAGTGFYGEDFETVVDETARIHPTAHVAPRNVRIGAGVNIDANVTVLEKTVIGADCVLRPGVVVGSEGFEVRDICGRRMVLPHMGGVRLGQRVQLQANTSVSKGLLGDFTSLGDDSATDNLVHIAHGVSIGRRCRIAASAMIAGSTTIGDDVWIGPNATISNSLRIGDRARISLGAVVTRDVPDDGHVTGHFAVDHPRFIAFMRAAFSRQRVA